MKRLAELLIFILCSIPVAQSSAKQKIARFNALVLYENGGHHVAYSAAAKIWLDKLAADSNFSISYINNTEHVDGELLHQCQLFIQLDYPPYHWNEKAVNAFQDYIKEGWGGWIGFHHASLLGKFDGFPLWQWFSGFMGGIQFKNYIPSFADGMVNVEDTTHPAMKNLPEKFLIEKEEWYTYDKSPRPDVKVIARVDESTYAPAAEIKMGDHPVVWTNPDFAARNIYIFMGHSPALFNNKYYTTLFRNAIFWAALK